MTIPVVVTLDQARLHLNMPPSVGSPDSADADFQMKIDAATQLVCEYISDRNPADPAWIAEIESWGVAGSPVLAPPALIQAAVLFQFGEFVRFRGDEHEGPLRDPYSSLSPIVEGILRRYHDPVLA
jgi:hypothetical protein